jgi:hypothetical protein
MLFEEIGGSLNQISIHMLHFGVSNAERLPELQDELDSGRK